MNNIERSTRLKIEKELKKQFTNILAIGFGGTSATYSFKNPNSERRVLKVVFLQQFRKDNQEKQLEMLQKEYDYLKIIDSRFVVKVYNSFILQDAYVIEEEHISCGDLSKFVNNCIQTQNFLPEDLALLLITDMVIGLSELHKNHLIHRDVKCDNILIEFKIQDRQLIKRFVLCDLGIARQLDYTDQEALSRTGTLPYISPQIVKGELYTNKTDIWSLGVTVFLASTGQFPFVGKQQEMYQKIIGDEPNYQMIQSQKIRRLVQLMLRKNEDERPSAFDLFNNDDLFDLINTELMIQRSQVE